MVLGTYQVQAWQQGTEQKKVDMAKGAGIMVMTCYILWSANMVQPCKAPCIWTYWCTSNNLNHQIKYINCNLLCILYKFTYIIYQLEHINLITALNTPVYSTSCEVMICPGPNIFCNILSEPVCQ